MLQITNLNVGIGIPLTFPFVYQSFFDSFVTLEKPARFLYFRSSNGPLERLRNDLVKNALHNGCTHLLMMDVDQIYHPETIVKLLSYNLPVVGALVHRRYPPFDPLILKGEINKFQTVEDYEEGELIEVDATGTGCILFNMEVFRKIPDPWFEFIENDEYGFVGEDIWFCRKLKQAGYKIFVDTSLQLGHLSTLAVTGETYKLYRNMKHMSKFGIDFSKLDVREE